MDITDYIRPDAFILVPVLSFPDRRLLLQFCAGHSPKISGR